MSGDMFDREPTEEPTEDHTGAEPKPTAKGRQSLSKIRRELSDEELLSPAVQRMLVDEIERLERENADLSEFRTRFHSMDKKAVLLEERAKKSLSGEIVFGACLTIGAAAIGYAPAAWSSQPSGWLSLIFGTLLVAGGIVSRVVQR